MFNLEIATNFKIGSYVFNTSPIAVEVLPVKIGDTTMEGWKGFSWNGLLALVNRNPVIPTDFHAFAISYGFKPVHNWKLRNGHYEAYFANDNLDVPCTIRYIWDWTAKSSQVQLVRAIDNFFLPITELSDLNGDNAEEIFDSTKNEIPAYLSPDFVEQHLAKIAELTFGVAKTEAFSSEIQRMLLESPTSLHAIARTISHAYMPLTYKQAIQKSYIEAAKTVYANTTPVPAETPSN